MALKGVKVEGIPYHFDYNYLENIPQIDDELSQNSDNLVKNNVIYAAIQELNSRITNLTTQNNSLNSQITNLAAQNNSLSSQITNLTNRVAYLETHSGGSGDSGDETTQVTDNKLSLSGSNANVSDNKLSFTSGATVSDNKLII